MENTLSSLVKISKSILLRFAWAPISVVLLHALLVAIIGHYRRLDPMMHFLGGAALQYFFANIFSFPLPGIGSLKRVTRMAFAFTLSCTVALGWEIAEFVSDRWLLTHIQVNVEETMTDLIMGVAGAFIVLSLMIALKGVKDSR